MEVVRHWRKQESMYMGSGSMLFEVTTGEVGQEDGSLVKCNIKSKLLNRRVEFVLDIDGVLEMIEKLRGMGYKDEVIAGLACQIGLVDERFGVEFADFVIGYVFGEGVADDQLVV